MKPVFKCDYCSQMGTEEEIREHELICLGNYDRKSCYTCVHKTTTYKDNQLCYECQNGKEIPQGKFIEFCSSYERDEKGNNPLRNLFGGFGDIFSK